MQKQLFSLRQIWGYFLIDRPFSALLHWFLNPLLGTSPIPWRIFGQLLNWSAVLVLVKTLLQIWPKRVFEIGWIGLLLAHYPGITRQFVIRTSIAHYTSMFLFALSLYCMVKAVKDHRYRFLFTGLSAVLGIIQMLLIEYFAGLELIRLLLLLYLVREESTSFWNAARNAFRLWLPYAAIFLAFVIFRLGILPAIQAEGTLAKHQPSLLIQFVADPIPTVISYAEVIAQDVLYAVLYVWSMIFVPEELDLNAKATVLSWLVGAVLAAICAVSVWFWHHRSVREEERERHPYLVVGLSLAALLLGGLPIWMIGRQAIQGIWASRFLFGLILGAVPLVIIFTVWFAGQQRRSVQSIFLAVLLAGSISLQFRTANKYALNWVYQRDYYWQLKWRAPALQPGTFILASDTPFSYNADYEIAFAINMMYDPGRSETTARYWWFDGPDDIRDYLTETYPTELEIDHEFRSLRFVSDMQHALPVFYRPARGCLQVVSGAYQYQPGLLPEEQQLYSVQNSGLITDKGAAVPQDIFGSEPEHGWCYYFQKADRAREMGKWAEAAALWDESASLGLYPDFAPEYLPFIESSMRTNRWEQALRITRTASESKDMAPFLCASWSRIVKEIPDSAEKQASWDTVKAQLGCGNPSDSQTAD